LCPAEIAWITQRAAAIEIAAGDIKGEAEMMGIGGKRLMFGAKGTRLRVPGIGKGFENLRVAVRQEGHRARRQGEGDE
jgi:hypothetical protein